MSAVPTEPAHRWGPACPMICECPTPDIGQAQGTSSPTVAEFDYPTEWCLPQTEKTNDASDR